MYGGSAYVTSELISSYAWDTALNFICQNNGYYLATTTSSNYGNINTGERAKTGMYLQDSYSNIYDMLGNVREYTTECVRWSSDTCVIRGGLFSRSDYYSAHRQSGPER